MTNPTNRFLPGRSAVERDSILRELWRLSATPPKRTPTAVIYRLQPVSTQ